jgi:hypothetical protein
MRIAAVRGGESMFSGRNLTLGSQFGQLLIPPGHSGVTLGWHFVPIAVIWGPGRPQGAAIVDHRDTMVYPVFLFSPCTRSGAHASREFERDNLD